MISLPFSLELGVDEDARKILRGDNADPVDGKIKLFFGESVDIRKRQSLVGVIEGLSGHLDTDNAFFWGHSLSGSAGSFKKGAVFEGSELDICIIVGDNFARTSSLPIHETIDQLLNSLVELNVDEPIPHVEADINPLVYIKESGTAVAGVSTHAINLYERKSFNDVFFVWVAYQKVADTQSVNELNVGGVSLTLLDSVKSEFATVDSSYLDLWVLKNPLEGPADLSVVFEESGGRYALFGGVFSDVGEIVSVNKRSQVESAKVSLIATKGSGTTIFAGGVKDGIAGGVFTPLKHNTELLHVSSGASTSAFLNAIVGPPGMLEAGSTSSIEGTVPPELSAIISVEFTDQPKEVSVRHGGGGSDWAPVIAGANSSATNENCAGVSTDEKGVVVAVFSGGHASRSTDGGETWGPLHRGLGQPILTAAWYGLDTNKMGVWIAVGRGGVASRSENNGITWSPLPDWINTGSTTGGISSACYVGNNTWVACASGAYCSRSTDNGLTWTAFGRGLDGVLPDNGGPTDFAADFRGVVVAGGSFGFAARSEDYGETWVQLPQGLDCVDPFMQIYTICTNQYGLWFVGMQRSYSSLSLDNGKTWKALPRHLGGNVSGNPDISASVSDGRGTIVALFGRGYAFISKDWGKTWKDLPRYLNSNGSDVRHINVTTDRKGKYIVGQTKESLVQSPPPSKTHFGPLELNVSVAQRGLTTGDGKGVWFDQRHVQRSGDGGLTWQPLPKLLGFVDLAETSTYIPKIISGKDNVWIAAFTYGYARRSTDNGLTWTALPRGLNSGSPHSPQASFYCLDTDKQGVWIAGTAAGYASRSTDNGLTWTALPRGLNSGLSSPSFSRLGTNRLGDWIMCCYYSTFVASYDNGITWTKLQDNLGFGNQLGLFSRFKRIAHRFLQRLNPMWGLPKSNLQASDVFKSCMGFVCVGDVFIAIARGGYVARSADKGQTWIMCPSYVNSGDSDARPMHTVSISIDQNSIIFYSSANGNTSYSKDLGITWLPSVKGLNSGVEGTLGYLGGANGTIAQFGLHSAINPPIKVPVRWGRLPMILRPTTVESITSIEFSGDNIYVAYAVQLSLRSADGGRSWTEIDPSSGATVAGPVKFFKAGMGTFVFAFYAGTPTRSVDNGKTWDLMPLSLDSGNVTGGSVLSATCINRNDGYVLASLAGGWNSRSVNSGRTWEPMQRGLNSGSEIFSDVVAMENDQNGIVIAVHKGGWVSKSTDYGLSWNPLVRGLNCGDDEQELMLLTTDESGIWIAASEEGFVSRSIDNGETWTPLPRWLGISTHSGFNGIINKKNQFGESIFVVTDSSGGVVASNDSGDLWFIVERIDNYVSGTDPISAIAASEDGRIIIGLNNSEWLISSPPLTAMPESVPSLNVVPGNSNLTLTWGHPDSVDAPLTGYLIYWRRVAEESWNVSTTGLVLQHQISQLTTGDDYVCRVAALCNLGRGEFSITKLGQPT